METVIGGLIIGKERQQLSERKLFFRYFV